MKSTRMAAMAAVMRRACWPCAPARSRAPATTRRRYDQRRLADPGQHAGGDPAVQQPGHGVREGQPDRSRSSRSSTSGPARRSPPSSPPARCRRCSRCRSPTPGRSGDNGQLADMTRRGQGAAVLREVQPGGHRRGHDVEGQDRRAAEGGVRAGAALQPQALRSRPASTRTSRRRPGLSCGRRQADRAEDRQGRATPRWPRTTTPPAGS